MTLREPTTLIRPPAYRDPRDAELRDRGDALSWAERVRRTVPGHSAGVVVTTRRRAATSTMPRERVQAGRMTMELEKRYQITYFTDSWLQRHISAAVFYAFLAFMVWLSLGSTWWTFFFGTLALLVIWTRITMAWSRYHKSFNSKAELLEFVQSLPEEPNDD